MNLPAISVIVPLYNAQKYLADCLNSLLAQTFTDFELIVVDDCSTDNSVAIVKSYAARFGGRLKLTRTKENSGHASVPRNKGVDISRGEYIYFIDPDDAVTPTALEELYTAAKSFDADVVHCEKYYTVPDEFWNDAEFLRNIKPYSWPMEEKRFITRPTLLTDDLEQRVTEFGEKWLQWVVWNQLIHRELLIENDIRFVSIFSEDLIFNMCELCCAKRYVVLPNVIYFYRWHEGSKIWEKLDVPNTFHKYVATLKYGMQYLDEFLSEQPFFAGRADLKYAMFNVVADVILERLDQLYVQNPAYMFDEFLQKELADQSPAPAAFNFNAMNFYRLKLKAANFQIQQRTSESERQDKAYIAELEKFIGQSQKYIAELENEVRRLKGQV